MFWVFTLTLGLAPEGGCAVRLVGGPHTDSRQLFALHGF